MPLSLTDVELIAREISSAEDSALEVLAARHGEGAADYIEIILTLHRQATGPTQVVVGVSSNSTPSEMRRLFRVKLREHVQNLS